METVQPWLRTFVDTAAGALVSSVWQGLALVTIVAVSIRLLRGLTASAKSAVWTAVLLLIMVLPISYLFPLRVQTGLGITIHAREGWGVALFGAWAIMSIVRAAMLARSAISLQGIMSRALPIEPEERIARILRSALRPVQLCTSIEIKRPCVVGFSRPRILFPASLLRVLAIQDLEQVIFHEMEHLRRQDHWTNLLQQASLVMFPLHPAVAWIDRRLAIERELACDDEVVRVIGARKAYASCLARIAEHFVLSRGLSLAVAVLGRFSKSSEITQRIQRILHKQHTELTGIRLRVASGFVFALIIVSGGVFACSPQLASFASATQSGRRAVQTASVSVRSMPLQDSGMRPTLVKAIMPSGNLRMCQALHAGVARHTNKQKANQSYPHDVSSVVLTHRTSPTRTAQSALTSARFSQASYAAIPFEDGWLIVQL